jgi:hypothetical protein
LCARMRGVQPIDMGGGDENYIVSWMLLPPLKTFSSQSTL